MAMQWVDFVNLFRDLHILEMDRCNLEIDQVRCTFKLIFIVSVPKEFLF
jgi:hypothetical protein